MDCLTDSGTVRVLGGALASMERGKIETHLIECENCTRLLAEAARDTFTDESEWLDRFRPSLLAPEAVVADRYRVIRTLGSGAMGEVYEVEDRLLGKTVALKTLNAMLTGRPGAIARLKTEVGMAHRVTHPNVCRIFDLGIDQSGRQAGGSIAFLTMEYLRGETVSRFLARGKPPAREALSLLTQIAEGLAAAHDVGVVHRDLKPDNVMLVPHFDRGLRAVITDFGLAGMAVADRSEVARARGFSGTFSYAAPERIAGRAATPASDVYSFGLLAQEMLTGHLPPTASAAAVAAAFRLGERLGWDEGLPSVHQPAWDRFVLGTLHPEPRRRFQNGGQALRALRVLATKRSATERKRWPLAAGLVTGALTVALVAAVASQPSPSAHRAPAGVQRTSTAVTLPKDESETTPTWLRAPAKPPRQAMWGARAVSSPAALPKGNRRPLAGNAGVPGERLLAPAPDPASPPAARSPKGADEARDTDIVRELRSRNGTSAAKVLDPFARAGANSRSE